MKDLDKEFIYQITDWQGRLFGYLVTLLGNVHDARDVLQETNLVLLRKIENFSLGSDFGAWARKCAYYEALAFLRDRKRDRHLFDDELLAQFSNDVEGDLEEDANDLILALRDCLTHLSGEQRELIQLRYGQGQPLKKLAKDFEKKESAMKMTLMRIRQSLYECIELKRKETR